MSSWSDYELENRSKQRHKMQDVVDEMCRIMTETPFRFEDTRHTVNFDNGIELWKRDMTKVWEGTDTVAVFTYEQARQLKAAYDKTMVTKKSRTQERLERSFMYKHTQTTKAEGETASSERRKNRDRGIGVGYVRKSVPTNKKWWEFWK
ncbi:hypothetical protein VPFG_00302 [Vibrio phage nt-1]|uniref:Uncharacterized protein n=1 Tax=Vibrio phage nt-1 TaxID=115992 RepID=R9TET6_9CAUD|nr:hypothetical protein VPFG_00302 [Vibrio phage nt-1]AGN30301.1 hypothetical protein VPFG_00302 [Vibrio phage nt-1]